MHSASWVQPEEEHAVLRALLALIHAHAIMLGKQAACPLSCVSHHERPSQFAHGTLLCCTSTEKILMYQSNQLHVQRIKPYCDANVQMVNGG